MSDVLSRRRLLQVGGYSVVGASLLARPEHWMGAARAQTPTDPSSTSSTPSKKKKDKGPPLADDLVKAFVGAAHGDLEKTTSMLAEYPALVNATWDWGGGDFETALGGAAHMGRRDIALFLLEKQARLDIYAAAMLGYLDIVKITVSTCPQIVHVPGPHNITLRAHAEAGGEESRSVLEFLQSLP